MTEVHIPDTVEELQAEVEHVVSLKRGMPPHAACTCGWKTDPSRELFALANAAFDHAAETGHLLRNHPETT